MKLKNDKGITLVALIITIIVMVILAAIAIAFSVGEDGVVSRAEQAKQKQSQATEQERVKLVESAAKTAGLGKIETEILRRELKDEFGEENKDFILDTEKDKNNYIVTIVESGKEYLISKSKDDKGRDNPPVENDFYGYMYDSDITQFKLVFLKNDICMLVFPDENGNVLGFMGVSKYTKDDFNITVENPDGTISNYELSEDYTKLYPTGTDEESNRNNKFAYNPVLDTEYDFNVYTNAIYLSENSDIIILSQGGHFEFYFAGEDEGWFPDYDDLVDVISEDGKEITYYDLDDNVFIFKLQEASDLF